jgi:hypothetical protein
VDEGTLPSATQTATHVPSGKPSATHTGSPQPSVSATSAASASVSSHPDAGDGGSLDAAVPDGGGVDAGPSDSGPDVQDASDGAAVSDGSVVDAAVDAAADAATADPTFQEVQTYFLNLGCGAGSSGPPRPGVRSCHGDSAAGGLSLVGPDALDALLNIESPVFSGEIRVIPGDPDNSLLMKKLTNNLELADGGTLGAPMPTGEAIQWHEAEGVDLVRQWIAAGAQP